MKKAYFLTDLHLGASYNENNRQTEKAAVAFLDSIKEDADEIYLLGDILDYWFEYKHVVPKGYVRFFGKLAELSDKGVKITWMIGNHDIWIFDYIPSELGIEVIDGITDRNILGTEFCIQHGDSIGGTRQFKFLRYLFRNKFCQKLYSGIHPRWTVGFAYNCSKRSRLSKTGEKGYKPKNLPNLIVDLRAWCRNQIKEGNNAKYYLFGHLHKQYDEELPEGKRLLVLPAFPEKHIYGVFDGKEFRMEQYGN